MWSMDTANPGQGARKVDRILVVSHSVRMVMAFVIVPVIVAVVV